MIPPRKNAKPWKETLVGALTRNEALKVCCNGRPTTVPMTATALPHLEWGSHSFAFTCAIKPFLNLLQTFRG